ncbi:hypothetical protein HK405_014160 [Cladochytrium tenue]|nr:hypothetical protein HK405_014160 [Cladochytrium tenue]
MASLIKYSLEPFLSSAHPTAPITFSAIRVGELTLSHRIALAPLTRSRSPKNIPHDLNALYYAQRATPGGLIVSEATPACLTGYGYPAVPGVHTEEQARGWQKVTSAVHDRGGYIFAQLWHVGRVSQPQFQPGGADPVSASATPLFSRRTKVTGNAHALTLSEIAGLVAEYRESARLAREVAGFDGVEIHAAHGYLIDQFLHSSSNLRTDQYGGSIENRARFLFEVLDAVLSAVPRGRVAIRISPFLGTHAVSDPDDAALFEHVVRRLADYGLAYIQFTEPGYFRKPADAAVDWHAKSRLNPLIALVKAPTAVMLTGGYLLAEGELALQTGRAHLIGVGRPFIQNPDLVQRFWHGHPLTDFSSDALHYTPGPHGYTDYPTYLEEKAKEWVEGARL